MRLRQDENKLSPCCISNMPAQSLQPLSAPRAGDAPMGKHLWQGQVHPVHTAPGEGWDGAGLHPFKGEGI